MRKVSVPVDGEELEWLVFRKEELAALFAITDKNPRSHWVWVDYDSVKVWTAASSRVLRCAFDDSPVSDDIRRIPLKQLKAVKVNQVDALLVRHAHLDVVEVVRVRFKDKKWNIVPGVPFDEQDGRDLEEKLERVRIGVTAPANTDYTVPQLEQTLALNTGAPVPEVEVSSLHLGVIAKLDAVCGKNAVTRIVAGHGTTPCVLETRDPASGCVWMYALMPKKAKDK